MVPAALKHRGVKIVAAADVVAVYIATPNQFHLVHAVAAFASSRHVLLEKPMPTTIEEPGAIIAEAERLDDRCGKARRDLAKAQAAGDELAMKAAGRYGGSALIAVFRDEAPRSFSWTADLLFVVTGDKAEVHITPDSVIFYGEDEIRRVEFGVDETGWDGPVRLLYDAIVHACAPLTMDDGPRRPLRSAWP